MWSFKKRFGKKFGEFPGMNFRVRNTPVISFREPTARTVMFKDPHQNSDLGNWALDTSSVHRGGHWSSCLWSLGCLSVTSIACPAERVLTSTMLLNSQKQLKAAGRHLHFLTSVFRFVRASGTQLQRELRVQFLAS